MKVFISWSGDKSRLIAELLRNWLPDVINAVEPWMSSADIEKGAAGLPEIATQLKACAFGIVCLTQENQHRPWINYEAGALSKSVGDDASRVATILVDIAGPTEVTGPLAQFQATALNLEDVRKLALSLDKVTENPRSPDRVERVVESMWPQFETGLAAALERDSEATDANQSRSEREMLEEILTLTRELTRVGPIQSMSINYSDPTSKALRLETHGAQGLHDIRTAFNGTLRAQQLAEEIIRTQLASYAPFEIFWPSADNVIVQLVSNVPSAAIAQINAELEALRISVKFNVVISTVDLQ
ncbi:MAG TPA: TIR domain-containing protein [Jatrophihabitantaceae bacterium]|jgi:hypothetical protein|nr:TIR domain-containing protein [Jatrophihabitantaceae bacterium]